jgi:hypothetical protein
MCGAGPGATGKTSSISSHVSPSSLQALSASAPSGTLTEQQVTETSLQYCKVLEKELGLNRFQAMGIVANLRNEDSGLGLSTSRTTRPVGTDAGKSAENPEAAGGIVKWGREQAPRLAEYARQQGIDPASDRAKIGFLIEELRGPHREVLDAVLKETTMVGTSQTFRNQFEGSSESELRSIRLHGYDLIRNYKA